MKSWVKLYTKGLHDPDDASLTWAQRGIWAAILQLAGVIDDRDEQGRETGRLDTEARVAWHLRCDPDELRAALDEFEARGMVDEREGGILYATNYGKRQARKPSARPEAVAERVNRHRAAVKRECNEDVTPVKRECNADVTPVKRPVTPSESESESESESDTPQAALERHFCSISERKLPNISGPLSDSAQRYTDNWVLPLQNMLEQADNDVGRVTAAMTQAAAVLKEKG